ncbi:hypothetical protein [Microbacterium sp. A93]|uniref:hypothetical protein n=1 Tax=Microbacterium sp. A93 TaxID=3450716 RepID=UPI003F424A4C
MTTADDLFALLPRHVLARDATENGGTGLLRAVLEAVAAEATVLEEDTQSLYDDFFVETAGDWALPYLADLLGIEGLPPGRGRRAVVANTVEYRRRKGTVAVAEQVARDVVGAPARAVEHHRLLAATVHVNHVRLDRPAVAGLRDTDERSSPAVAHGALDPLMHTAEVRRAVSGRGRYGIGNLWVYSFGTEVQTLRGAEATPDAATGCWWVHPLAVPTPLFAPPRAEEDPGQLAGEAELPIPLRPRRLLHLLRRARTDAAARAELPVAVTLVDAPGVPGQMTLGPGRLLVRGLEDLPADPAGWYGLVDPVTGQLCLHHDGGSVTPGSPASPERVLTDHAVGGRPGLGAGTYDRAAVHEDQLVDTSLYPGATILPAAQHPVSPGQGGDVAEALHAAEESWAEGGAGTVVVSLADSGTWRGDLAVTIPTAARLVLVAASYGPRRLPDGSLVPPVPGHYAPDGLRPVIRGDLTLRGGEGAAVVVDGITVVGDLVVRAEGMTSVSVAQSTVTGTIRIEGAGDVGAQALTLRMVRSLAGGLSADDRVPSLELVDSILSPEVGAMPLPPGGAMTVQARGAHLDVEGCTVRGDVAVRTLAGTDLLADGTVTVLHRQVHCLRYSRVGAGSSTPRRFRPAEAAPAYGSTTIGDPDFLVLSSPGLETASETDNEVGVDAYLRRPELLVAASRLVADYLPAGVELHLRAARRHR